MKFSFDCLNSIQTKYFYSILKKNLNSIQNHFKFNLKLNF